MDSGLAFPTLDEGKRKEGVFSLEDAGGMVLHEGRWGHRLGME